MLQRSRSKTNSKFNYLILIPLMLAMLTYVSCSKEIPNEIETSSQTVTKRAFVEMKVGDVENLTQDERESSNEVVQLLGTDGNASILILTDGESLQRIFVLKMPPPQKGEIEVFRFYRTTEAPIDTGCENLESIEERKACMTEKINQLVNTKFGVSFGRLILGEKVKSE